MTLPRYITSESVFEEIITFGSTPESQTLEFKATYDDGDPERHVKLRTDVTSLANTWGGVLAIGVTEEGRTGSYTTAKGLQPCDQRKMIKWVSDTLAEAVFPCPDFTPVPLKPEGPDGNKCEIVIVNVRPFSDTIGCGRRDECLRFHRRDEVGVRYFHPLEVMKELAGNIRRIRILLDQYVGPGPKLLVEEVYLASPAFEERMETESEWTERIGREAPHGVPTSGMLPKRRIETRRPGRNIFVRRWDGNQLLIAVAGRETLEVPLGLVREVWMHGPKKLGLALECDVVVSDDPALEAVLRIHR